MSNMSLKHENRERNAKETNRKNNQENGDNERRQPNCSTQ